MYTHWYFIFQTKVSVRSKRVSDIYRKLILFVLLLVHSSDGTIIADDRLSVVEWPAMNITNRCWKSNAIVADIADYRIVRFSILVLINSCISLLYYYFFPCTSKYILVYDIFCCMVFKKKKLERIDMVFIVVVIESALLNKTILFKEIMIWCLFQFIVGCKMKKKKCFEFSDYNNNGLCPSDYFRLSIMI